MDWAPSWKPMFEFPQYAHSSPHDAAAPPDACSLSQSGRPTLAEVTSHVEQPTLRDESVPGICNMGTMGAGASETPVVKALLPATSDEFPVAPVISRVITA